MTSIRDHDALLGLSPAPLVAPPVLTTARRSAPGAGSALGPLARAVAAPSRSHVGQAALSGLVRLVAWSMLVAAPLNVLLVAQLPLDFVDSLWFSDIVDYPGAATSIATWGGHALAPIVLSLIGAGTLSVAMVLSAGFASADLWTGVAIATGSTLVAVGAAATLTAIVVCVGALLLGIALAILFGVAVVCVTFMVGMAIAEG